MRTGFVVLLALVIVCTFWPAGTAAEDEVALTVSVVDQDDVSIGDATVKATWENGSASGTTASNGRVFIDVPQGADVELDIDDDRYVRNRPLVIRNASEEEVELRVFPQGTATVTVVDAEGQRLSGATVELREGSQIISSGETDSDGQFRTGIVERGSYNVTAVKPGFYRNREGITIRRTSRAEIALESGRVTLNVAVVDDHFEPPRPLSDARVQVEADSFDANVSAAEGSTSLNVPVNTQYRVSATKSGYEGRPHLLIVREEPRSMNVTAQRTPELVVTPLNDRVIIGETTRIEVRNAYDEPVPGVTVQLNGEEIAETDDRGEATVRIDTVGENAIVAADSETESDPVTITGVDPDSETEESEEEPDDEGDDEADETPTDTPDETPGFGITIAVIALVATFAAAAIRKRR